MTGTTISLVSFYIRRPYVSCTVLKMQILFKKIVIPFFLQSSKNVYTYNRVRDRHNDWNNNYFGFLLHPLSFHDYLNVR